MWVRKLLGHSFWPKSLSNIQGHRDVSLWIETMSLVLAFVNRLIPKGVWSYQHFLTHRIDFAL